MKKTTRRVKFAVVGQGHFAQAAVLPAFAEASGCELRALFSDDETKLRALKRKYGAEVGLDYEQYDEYLASGEVDAVYIALPNDRHGDFTIRAARAGVHVLCEKPIAVRSDEATRMIKACADNSVKLMVGYRLHFEAATLEAIERVRRGAIGRPRFLSSTFAMQVRDGGIRTQRKRGGGPLLDLGIYCVNAARSLFGAEPTEVTAMAATRKGEARFKEIDEQVSVALRFPEERLAQFTCSFGAYDHSALTVIGDKGRLTLDPAYDYATDLTLRMEVTGRKPSHKTFAKRDQVAAELVAFARCIRDDVEPEPNGTEGLADLRVLEAIQRAAKSRRTESVATVGGARRPRKAQAIRRKPHDMPDVVHVKRPGRGS
jgi:predicted dehydrogenase